MKKQEVIKKVKGFYMNEYSFEPFFKDIVLYEIDNYDDDPKKFFSDLREHGCISGMIGEFVYNVDCKKFYIEHMDDLDEYKDSLEQDYCEPIKNRHSVLNYTFICWLAFEEYCNNLYK